MSRTIGRVVSRLAVLAFAAGGCFKLTEVELVPPMSVELTPYVSTINVGDSVLITPIFYSNAGAPIQSEITRWTSSDTSIAVVVRGRVRGKRPGSVVIVGSSRSLWAQAGVTVR